MIDTHTHLYLPEFDDDRDAVMRRAFDNGVVKMIFPNVDLTTIGPMQQLHAAWPGNTFMAMGLHPTEVADNADEALELIFNELADAANYVAVGEIGIDLYWDKTYEAKQMEVFDIQCRRAMELGLPVIIHCREGLDPILEVISGYGGKLAGVFHSFGGNPADVERIRNYGDFYFGINGIATFKNARLDNTINEITAGRLLLETDAPYLAPVPHRGKRNESSFLGATMARVAQALQTTPAEIDQATTANAESLFRLG